MAGLIVISSAVFGRVTAHEVLNNDVSATLTIECGDVHANLHTF